MIAALMLLTYAGVVSVVGGRILRRPWSSRAPRAAVVGWQALSTSVVTAILLAAVSLALPFLPLRFSLASVLGAHSMAIVEHYETRLGVWPGVVGLAIVAALAAMLFVTTTGSFSRKRRVRRSQLDSLRLVGHPHPDGFTVIDHVVPVAYCLPRGAGAGTVVLSSAAIELLDERERVLVLGHERSHLRARHDLALAYSDALTRTFPWVPLFALAHAEVATLLEMAADDAAAGPEDRRRLASALVTLGTGIRPETALAASNTATLQRVRRLTSTPPPVTRGLGVMVSTAAAVVLSVPVGLALAPAVEAAATDCCTLSALATRG